jgi:tetratricopeptide (TPR) repeat protein/transglutaminase-like putative cysteine protease
MITHTSTRLWQAGCLGSLLVVFFGAAPGRAADAAPVARGPSHEPDPYHFSPALLKQVPQEFLEDHPACILYVATTHLVDRDGTVETITHEITRLNGRKGVENLGEYRNITYDPTYQKLTLNEARIIKPDGTIVAVEPQYWHIRDIGTDYSVYDRDKQLVISFPNLAVGDIYEVKWTVRGKSPEFGGHFFWRYTFGDEKLPVVRDELRVRLPKEKPFKHASINGKLRPARSEKDGLTTYHWQVLNRPSPVQESDRPSKEESRLEVACSTFASWEEVGAWKLDQRGACWKCTPEIRATIKQVTRGLQTTLEKARALTYWVRRNVRYISVSSAGHGYTPRLPGQVLASRYGDCKDQAQLLAVMLKEIGVLPWLVTLGMRDDGQIIPDVPSPWGTHAILLVEIDGREHWIDTTATLAGWDFLPRPDRDRMVYATRDDKIRLLHTPPLTWADNRIEQETEVQVLPGGTSRVRRTAMYHGRAALERRDTWSETPPGERRRLISAELQNIHSHARLQALRIDDVNLNDPDQPLRATMNFKVSEHFHGEDSLEGSVSDGAVWDHILSVNLDPDRQGPLSLGAPFESIHRFTIRVPLIYEPMRIPVNQEVKSPWGWFRLTSRKDSRDPRRIEVVMHTRLEKDRVVPADFAAFQKFTEDLGKAWRAWLVLRPTRDLRVARVLELLQQFAPDPQRARALARLYLDHDKEDEAQRVVRQALIYYPRDVSLWELAVRSAGSLKEREKLYRDMSRQFPDRPQYTVSLGATLVKEGAVDEARKVLLSLTANPSGVVRAQAHFYLAQCALARKQPAVALKHLDLAGVSDWQTAHSLEALTFRALVYEKRGQLAKAIDTYKEALESDDRAPDVLASLVRLELTRKRRDQALVYLRRLTAQAEGHVEYLNKAAEFHLRLDRLDDAIDLAGRADAVDSNEQSQRILGLAYFRKKAWERAADHLERAKPDAGVLESLIRAHLALGRLLEAQADVARIEKVRRPTPALVRAGVDCLRLGLRKLYLAKAIKAGKNKQWSEALDALVCAEYALEKGEPRKEVEALLRKVFDAGVEAGPAYSLRALLALEQGRLSPALTDSGRALELGPAEARAFLVRGRVRLERQEAGALSDLEHAARLSNREDASILHWLAAAQFQAGQRSAALATQRSALQLRPDDPEMLQQLRRFENGDSD